ncbi:MAG: site-specific integrase [archaeon]|nr:site-specific integrase [archaeon]
MQGQKETLLDYSKRLETVKKQIQALKKPEKENLFDFSLRYCEKKKLSPARHLKLLVVMKKCIEYAGKPLTSFKEKDLESINIKLAQKGVSKTTINDYRKFLSQYFHWAGQKNFVESEELKRLKLNGENKIRAIDLPTEEETFAMLQALNIKYRAMLSLFFGGGLRLSEATTLRRQDVELKGDKSIICHVTGKTGSRSVPITPSLACFVTEYLNNAGIQDDQVLFAGENGKRFLSYAAIKKAFKRAAIKTGIYGKRKTNVHIFRHAHATWSLLHLPAPLAKVRLWGSATSRMDENYLHVTEAESHAAYNKATGQVKEQPKKELFENKVCFKCGKSFNALASICDNCNLPLNPSEIINREAENTQRFEALVLLIGEMRQEMEEMKKFKGR